VSWKAGSQACQLPKPGAVVSWSNSDATRTHDSGLGIEGGRLRTFLSDMWGNLPDVGGNLQTSVGEFTASGTRGYDIN
jgi:hypothetical protein